VALPLRSVGIHFHNFFPTQAFNLTGRVALCIEGLLFALPFKMKDFFKTCPFEKKKETFKFQDYN